jgi:hypothetical protein
MFLWESSAGHATLGDAILRRRPCSYATALRDSLEIYYTRAILILLRRPLGCSKTDHELGGRSQPSGSAK